MKGNKKKYLKNKAGKELVLRQIIFQIMIILMFLVVIYDSFRNSVPFYYICFLLLGLLVGRILSIADKVKHGEEDGKFTIESSLLSLIILMVLLSIRFFFGRHLLSLANVVWITDALYLFFIGVYWSKLKSMVRQMDEIIYGILEKRE